jgi:protein involved in polysaccharide export with SLBB domain|nr:polysaccharide biosynthesis/export family protein [Sphingomonas sp. H160509]
MTGRLGSAAVLTGSFALILSGCSASRPPALPSDLAAKPADVYRLGLGDKLRVNVYGEPALSGEYQIGGSGAVTMPLIGDVRAVGLSARELESALIQRYTAGYLKSPKIAVEVYDFRPYFILGEVQRPGRFPSTEATTVLGAIATAGGFSYRANKKRAFLRRAGTDQEYEIDLAKDVRILPGDVLRIGERYF